MISRLLAADLELGVHQQHNYCEAGDEDWVKFSARAGQTYLITVWPDDGSPLGSGIDLYQLDESGLLFHSRCSRAHEPAHAQVEAPADDLYLIRLASLVSCIMGDNTTYPSG